MKMGGKNLLFKNGNLFQRKMKTPNKTKFSAVTECTIERTGKISSIDSEKTENWKINVYLKRK